MGNSIHNESDDTDFIFGHGGGHGRGDSWLVIALVLLVASVIYLGCSVSPPSLMDDVDGVHGVIAQNMLHSGDWVTMRLDGVKYLEKAPLIYWGIVICFKIFGVH